MLFSSFCSLILIQLNHKNNLYICHSRISSSQSSCKLLVRSPDLEPLVCTVPDNSSSCFGDVGSLDIKHTGYSNTPLKVRHTRVTWYENDMSTVLDNKWTESYWMNDLRKVKTLASSLVPLGAGPVAPLCFYTRCPDYVESCGIVTGRLEYPLLQMYFSAGGKKPFGLWVYRDKCGKMWEISDSTRNGAASGLMWWWWLWWWWRAVDVDTLDYISRAGTKLHQRDRCGRVWRMWPFS